MIKWGSRITREMYWKHMGTAFGIGVGVGVFLCLIMFQYTSH